jgi:hypothetical protein
MVCQANHGRHEDTKAFEPLCVLIAMDAGVARGTFVGGRFRRFSKDSTDANSKSPFLGSEDVA